MIKRFLIYSLNHHRPVKVLFADTLKYSNITVIGLEGEKVEFLTPGRKTPRTENLSCFLSASYARGDDGDTLQYAQAEEKDE